MGRFVPINVTTVIIEKVAPVVAGAKSYYNGKECWQNKVVYDRPGSYTFTVPSNAICARTVIVGGGGKPKCISVNFDGTTCNSAAGAGGAYSEQCHAVTGGTTYFSIVVGRQEQDSTVGCNGTAVHTAGGASGMIPGVGTGGNWNSRGGCAGWTCNYCGGSYSHYCGSCKYLNITGCCGYCIVYTYSDAANGSSSCCNLLVAGGGSAGSPNNTCGGSASAICGYYVSGVAGGGAGIGSSCQTVWHYNCCSCICLGSCSNSGVGFYPNTNYPGSAEGGGGTKDRRSRGCRSQSADCMWGQWAGGSGGAGGNDLGANSWKFEWGCTAMCVFPYGTNYNHQSTETYPSEIIESHCWWDISSICGSGSPGVVAEHNQNTCGLCLGFSNGSRPMNSGEGAGTGGWMTYYCCGNWLGNGISAGPTPLVNWLKLCNLGTTQQCDQAWLMQDSLFPFFVTCAGTLGGSGGIGIQGLTSKAGKGGGGGQAKCQFLCVCWGGAYNFCNQDALTPLAFPPCLLDQMVSNAGTGMAIIYYREA